ncbi:TolC family protein, partial [Halomonas sp.]|uniref:TolC family protein n=1 Tax=Halomonas sp. TaxID=1486246 RepID=UPI003F9B34DC
MSRMLSAIVNKAMHLTVAAAVAGMVTQPLYAQQDTLAEPEAMEALASLDQPAPTQVELPSLPELFARALEHDAALSRQRYELAATREEIPMSRSQLLPQISATGGYLWQDSTNIQTSPDDFGLDKPAQRPGEIEETYWQVQLQ